VSATDKAKGYKTLAIRLDDDVHAQLQIIARLQETSIAAEIQHAIEAHLQAKRSDPELSSRAASVLETIEAEARQRHDAIASLFADKPTDATASKATRPKSTRS
jgi:predicted transcriptional regulator